MTTTTRVYGVELVGIQAKLVPILIFTPENGPSMQITGLSENAATELRVRIRSVLHCLEIDPERIGISIPTLATDGGGHGLDLPVLIGVLAHLGKIPNPTTSIGPALEKIASFGSVSLSGAIQPVRGAYCRMHNIPLGSALRALWIIPRGNANEAWSAEPTGSRFLDVASVQDLLTELRRHEGIPEGFMFPPPPPLTQPLDIPDGNAHISPRTLRVLEIAAASGAGLLLGGRLAILCARRLTHLLPPLSVQEMTEVTSVHSAAMGLENGAVLSRPFRAPHHTVSEQGLIGSLSARMMRPGEVSLAHRGVLLLDQLDEFRRPALDSAFQLLRQGEMTSYNIESRLPTNPANVVATFEHDRPSAVARVQRFQHHFPIFHVPIPGTCTPAEIALARERVAHVWRQRALIHEWTAACAFKHKGVRVEACRAPLSVKDTIAMLDEVTPGGGHEEEAQALLAERPAALTEAGS
jgi:magnesium chelatase family protein